MKANLLHTESGLGSYPKDELFFHYMELRI